MNNSKRETHFRTFWDRCWHGPEHRQVLAEGLEDGFLMHIASVVDPIPKEAWMDFVAAWRHAFPDGRMDIQDLVVRDDQIWVYWISSGTHSNEYLGVKASGNKVSYWGMEIYRFAGDKIARCTAVPDALSLFRQMGPIS